MFRFRWVGGWSKNWRLFKLKKRKNAHALKISPLCSNWVVGGWVRIYPNVVRIVKSAQNNGRSLIRKVHRKGEKHFKEVLILGLFAVNSKSMGSISGATPCQPGGRFQRGFAQMIPFPSRIVSSGSISVDYILSDGNLPMPQKIDWTYIYPIRAQMLRELFLRHVFFIILISPVNIDFLILSSCLTTGP